MNMTVGNGTIYVGDIDNLFTTMRKQLQHTIFHAMKKIQQIGKKRIIIVKVLKTSIFVLGNWESEGKVLIQFTFKVKYGLLGLQCINIKLWNKVVLVESTRTKSKVEFEELSMLNKSAWLIINDAESENGGFSYTN